MTYPYNKHALSQDYVTVPFNKYNSIKANNLLTQHYPWCTWVNPFIVPLPKLRLMRSCKMKSCTAWNRSRYWIIIPFPFLWNELWTIFRLANELIDLFSNGLRFLKRGLYKRPPLNCPCIQIHSPDGLLGKILACHIFHKNNFFNFFISFSQNML